jgi:hypothetical protein
MRYCLILLIFFLAACNDCQKQVTRVDVVDKNALKIVASNDSLVDTTTINEDYTEYWIVVADTGLEYPQLLSRMVQLKNECKIPVDSMGRFYNKKKNLIALPDNDEDEMYAGEYFPRRYESDYLSIEYLDFYTKTSSDKMMVIVAGIYEDKLKADSLFTAIKPKCNSLMKFKTSLYTGCMH